MGLLEILATTGFLLGAALNLALLLLMQERGVRRRGEKAFCGLVVSATIFYCSAFASLFLTLVFVEPPELPRRLLNGLAIVCLAAQPSLLLHTFLDLYFHARTTPLFRGALHVPTLLGLWPLSRLSGGLLATLGAHGTPLFLWYMAAHALTSVLALTLVQHAIEQTDRAVARNVGRALGPVWVLVMIAFPFGGLGVPVVGPFLELACLMTPLVPITLFGYAIYRYSYLGYFMRNALINSLLAFLLLCFYVFGIRQLGDALLSGIGVKVEVLEGLLIMGLVFAFSTIQGAGQKFYDRFVMRETLRKRETFARISSELGNPVSAEPNALLSQVAEAIAEALSVQQVGIFFVGTDGKVSASSRSPGPTPLDVFLEPFSTGRWFAVECEDLEEGRLRDAMLRSGVMTLVPVLGREGPVGLACLGPRPFDRPFAPDELDMLRLILNQLRVAVDKLQIFQQKIALERKLLEDERLASLGMLSASVAHEIKNPLSSMKAIIQVMLEGIPPGDLRREDLSVVLEEIDRLASTVTRLLDFIRPREAEERYVAVERVVERVLEIFSYEARRRKVAVVQRLSPEPHYLKGGLDSLKSVLFNLVLNSFQAMDESGTLTIETLSGGEGRAVIEVSDTGPGIPPEELARIFEPFHSSKKTGTGLGLALVKQRLVDLGGRIEVTSGSEGTRFRLELPVYTPANLRTQPAA